MSVALPEPGSRLELRDGHACGRVIARWVLVASGRVESRATALAVLAPDGPSQADAACCYLVVRPPSPQPEPEKHHAQPSQAGTTQALGQSRPRSRAEIRVRTFPFAQA